MRKLLFFVLTAMPLLAMGQVLSSPDGKYAIHIDGMTYDITFGGKTIVEKSQLGIDIDNRLFESALGVPRGIHENWCSDLVQKSVSTTQIDTTWTPLYGENASIRDH